LDRWVIAGQRNEQDGRRAVEAVWRIESARLVAGLARITGDVGLAEELAQDALVTALEQWPSTGIPPNPAGWLMTTAKNRAIDSFRRQAVHHRAVQTMGREFAEAFDQQDAIEDAIDDPIGDDVLRLLFTACHPVLPLDSRVALTLRCLAGLRTEEIARAFLVAESVAGQRISRAKKLLKDKDIRFELPTADELPGRLASVLEVIYLIFNEGYSATSGGDWMRPALAQEAMRLGRLVAELAPSSAEAHGLVALMELTASRQAARTGRDGAPVLLSDQDRSRWDRLLIRRGLAALNRADGTGGPVGAFTVQAAIAACHARAITADDTDWGQIAELYGVLAQVWPTPVVELNRAMAIGMAGDSQTGLDQLAERIPAGTLTDYPQLPAVRGELLSRLGRSAEAAAEFDRAAELTRNEPERTLFHRRAAECRTR
jgi:RNA polymerase sigma factor (sigma-70 family)